VALLDELRAEGNADVTTADNQNAHGATVIRGTAGRQIKRGCIPPPLFFYWRISANIVQVFRAPRGANAWEPMSWVFQPDFPTGFHLQVLRFGYLGLAQNSGVSLPEPADYQPFTEADVITNKPKRDRTLLPRRTRRARSPAGRDRYAGQG
jgi:hypothetical protein